MSATRHSTVLQFLDGGQIWSLIYGPLDDGIAGESTAIPWYPFGHYRDEPGHGENISGGEYWRPSSDDTKNELQISGLIIVDQTYQGRLAWFSLTRAQLDRIIFVRRAVVREEESK